jgi:hypothetical protein
MRAFSSEATSSLGEDLMEVVRQVRIGLGDVHRDLLARNAAFERTGVGAC